MAPREFEEKNEYRTYKRIRNFGLGLSLLIAITGLALGWAAWGNAENTPSVKKDLEFVHEAESNQNLSKDALEDWLLFYVVYLGLATGFVLIVLIAVIGLGEVFLSRARDACKTLRMAISRGWGGQDAESNIETSTMFLRVFMWISMVLLLLILTGAVVLLIHFGIGLGFVDEDNALEDDAKYFYQISIAGMVLAAVGALGGMAVVGYLIWQNQKICTRKAITPRKEEEEQFFETGGGQRVVPGQGFRGSGSRRGGPAYAPVQAYGQVHPSQWGAGVSVSGVPRVTQQGAWMFS